jgi:NAD(P)-dependent dehydrogenase (short-subunit alcohol dehydrogenase family)
MARTVLVTGANSGIGLATVIELARRGFDVVGSVRSAAKAKLVKEAGAEAGVEVRTVLLDVTDAPGCAQVVDRFRPYGVVNNAGYPATGAIEDVDDEESHRVVETMVFGPMRLARAALPFMREAGGGRIVNLSSIYGLTTTPLTGWYQGCKHALEALSDALRVEVARDGIRVVLIEPGGFRTGIWDETASDVDRRAGSAYEDAYQRLRSGLRITQPLMGDPRAVARTIAGAMMSRSPRPRYLVGYDARAIAFWDAVLPTEVKDRLARISLRL